MNHTDHHITYNENAVCGYQIINIDTENGVVEFDLRSSQIADLREKFLYCEDCGVRLEPEDVGLDADYLPVDKDTFANS